MVCIWLMRDKLLTLLYLLFRCNLPIKCRKRKRSRRRLGKEECTRCKNSSAWFILSNEPWSHVSSLKTAQHRTACCLPAPRYRIKMDKCRSGSMTSWFRSARHKLRHVWHMGEREVSQLWLGQLAFHWHTDDQHSSMKSHISVKDYIKIIQLNSAKSGKCSCMQS